MQNIRRHADHAGSVNDNLQTSTAYDLQRLCECSFDVIQASRYDVVTTGKGELVPVLN
jgi:hypothetical protein